MQDLYENKNLSSLTTKWMKRYIAYLSRNKQTEPFDSFNL